MVLVAGVGEAGVVGRGGGGGGGFGGGCGEGGGTAGGFGEAAQDRGVQVAERGRGVGAERLGQATAQLLERGKRLGRAAVGGQRAQVKPCQPLVQRMRQRQLLQVGHELAAGPAE